MIDGSEVQVPLKPDGGEGLPKPRLPGCANNPVFRRCDEACASLVVEYPDLLRQEFYGFIMANFAIRGLMHEAALQANIG